MLSGSFYESAGQRRLYYPEFDQRISSDPRATNNGVAMDSDGERAYDLFGSVSYHDLTLSGALNDRHKKVPTASFGTAFDDGREATTDVRAYVDLKWEHETAEDLRLMGRVAYDQYDYYGYSLLESGAAAGGDPEPGLLGRPMAAVWSSSITARRGRWPATGSTISPS